MIRGLGSTEISGTAASSSNVGGRLSGLCLVELNSLRAVAYVDM
jgi:hypothetical protein